MPITDSDLFLIEDTSGVSKKIEASKLKANLASNTYNNHKLLVNKPDYSSRFVYAQNMQASVGTTDYMLVERAGVSYKVNGQQIIDYFPSVPAGAAGPITDVVNTQTPIYNEAAVFPHSAGSLTNAVLFNGQFAAGFDKNNVGSYTSASQTTIVPFTPPLKGVAKVVAFAAPGGATGMTINHENGDTQIVPAGDFTGLTFLEVTVNSISPITNITMPGDTANSTWLSGFKNGSDQPIRQEAKESELTLASDANLDLFTGGDAITMVDSNGDVASYTPVTNSILSVSDASVLETWSDYGNGETYGGADYSQDKMFNTLYDYNNCTTGKNNGVAYFEWEFPQGIQFDPSLMSIHGSRNGTIDTSTAFYVNDIPITNINDLPTWTTTGRIDCKFSDPSLVGDRLYKIAIQPWKNKNGLAIAGVFLNGTQLVDGVAIPGLKLTFQGTQAADNPDLKYIKPGDVVQSIATGNGFDSDDISPGTVLSNDGFTATGSASGGVKPFKGASGTDRLYYELTIDTAVTGDEMIGVCTEYWVGSANQYAGANNDNGCCQRNGGQVFGGANWSVRGDNLNWTPGSVYGFAIDNKAGIVWLSRNGAWIGAEVDVSVGYFRLREPGKYKEIFPWVRCYSTAKWSINKTPQYPVPAGYTFSDGTATTGATALSVDTTTNSMVVDGGAWTGSDGSYTGPNQSRVWSADTTFSNVSNEENIKKLFDGSFSTISYGTSSTNQTITFNPPIVGTTFEISDAQAAGFNPVYTINGNSKTGVGVSNSPTSFNFTDISSIVVGGSLSEVVYSVNSGSSWTPGLNGIRVDGKLLVDTGLFEAPSTEVTGPVKSGTGNFAGNTGPVVDVSNSNQDWIDNQNRLGKEFFIKSASTRTGLAILRAKAAELAIEYNLTTTYQTGDVVFFNNYYWVRDNGSWLKISESTTTY